LIENRDKKNRFEATAGKTSETVDMIEESKKTGDFLNKKRAG